MLYNDLSIIKKINGIPVDLRYHEKIIENDSFFKETTDSDEKLSEFTEDILPSTSDTYSIGSLSKKIKNIYSGFLSASFLELPYGDLTSPSLKIGNIGLSSVLANELSFISSSGLEHVKLMTSGLMVRAANDAQLKIENINPATLASWSIGADHLGLKFYDNNFGNSLKVIFGTNSTSFMGRVLGVESLHDSPAFSFSDAPTTGLFRSSTNGKIGLSVDGSSKLELGQNLLTVNTEQSSLISLSVSGSLSLNKLLHSTVGLGQEIDITGISKLMVDTALGDVEISGFTGGIEGQMLYIYNKTPMNMFKLLFNSSTASQKVLLKGSMDYIISSDYGGIVLSFDEGMWREVSRS